MAILTTPSGAFPTALVYITVGTLMDVWTLVAWYFFPPESAWGKFWIAGLLATGSVLLAIGLCLGQIGRAARTAELPPEEVTSDVSVAEQKAAENPPPVAMPAPLAPAQPTRVQPAQTSMPR